MLLLVLAMMSCSDVIGSCCRCLSAVKVAPGPTGSLREVPLHQILCRCSSRLPTCLSAVRMCHLKMEIHHGSSPVPHWNTQHGSDWFIKGFKAADEVRSHQWRNADFYFLSLVITITSWAAVISAACCCSDGLEFPLVASSVACSHS